MRSRTSRNENLPDGIPWIDKHVQWPPKSSASGIHIAFFYVIRHVLSLRCVFVEDRHLATLLTFWGRHGGCAMAQRADARVASRFRFRINFVANIRDIRKNAICSASVLAARSAIYSLRGLGVPLHHPLLNPPLARGQRGAHLDPLAST